MELQASVTPKPFSSPGREPRKAGVVSTIGKEIGNPACKRSIRVGDMQKCALTQEDTPGGIPANGKKDRGFLNRSSTIVAKQGVRWKEAVLIPALMDRIVRAVATRSNLAFAVGCTQRSQLRSREKCE